MSGYENINLGFSVPGFELSHEIEYSPDEGLDVFNAFITTGIRHMTGQDDFAPVHAVRLAEVEYIQPGIDDGLQSCRDLRSLGRSLLRRGEYIIPMNGSQLRPQGFCLHPSGTIKRQSLAALEAPFLVPVGLSVSDNCDQRVPLLRCKVWMISPFYKLRPFSCFRMFGY